MIKKSGFEPRSILIPAVPLLTPVPVSPLLISIILSLTSKFCELTVVVVPLTLRFPVTVRLLTVVLPTALVNVIIGIIIFNIVNQAIKQVHLNMN